MNAQWKTQLFNYCVQNSIDKPGVQSFKQNNGKWIAACEYHGNVFKSAESDRKTEAEGQICKWIYDKLHQIAPKIPVGNGNVNSVHFVFVDVENASDSVKLINNLEIQGNITFVHIARKGHPLIPVTGNISDDPRIVWKIYGVTGKNACDFALVYNIGIAVTCVISEYHRNHESPVKEMMNFWLITKDNFGQILSNIISNDQPYVRFFLIDHIDKFIQALSVSVSV